MVLGLNTAPSITMATGEKNQEARKGGCFSTGLAVHLLQSLARSPACCVGVGVAEVYIVSRLLSWLRSRRVVRKEGGAVTCGVRAKAGLCLQKQSWALGGGGDRNFNAPSPPC